MSHVHRLRCDGCNREVDWFPGVRGAPDGWLTVDGPWGDREPYDQYHACSLDCLINWANRTRREDARLFGPADIEAIR